MRKRIASSSDEESEAQAVVASQQEAPGENPANEASGDECSQPLAADPPPSQDNDAQSLSDFFVAGMGEQQLNAEEDQFEDPTCPLYLRQDFSRVPRILRNADLRKFDLPLGVVKDDVVERRLNE